MQHFFNNDRKRLGQMTTRLPQWVISELLLALFKLTLPNPQEYPHEGVKTLKGINKHYRDRVNFSKQHYSRETDKTLRKLYSERYGVKFANHDTRGLGIALSKEFEKVINEHDLLGLVLLINYAPNRNNTLLPVKWPFNKWQFNQNSSSPLCYALSAEHFRSAYVLLQQGAMLSSLSEPRHSVLTYTVNWDFSKPQNVINLKYLLSTNPVVQEHDFRAFLKVNNLDIFKLYLEYAKEQAK